MNIEIRTASSAQTPEELLHDLRTLVKDAELMLNDSPTDGGGEPFSCLRARFDAARKQLGLLFTETKTTLSAGAKYADAAIRTHPYQSLAMALSAGLLIGVLVGRGRSK